MSRRLRRLDNLRAGRISKAGRVAFGTLWQSAMARAAGVSQSYIAMAANGGRPVTDDLYRKISGGLLDEADRLRKRAAQTDELARSILRELEN